MKAEKNSENKGTYALKLNVKQKYHTLVLAQMNLEKR